MKQNDFIKLFWNQYLDIESEMLECLKYIELSEEHYTVYSAKFVSIILECGAEIDNVFRNICNIDMGTRSNISTYYDKVIAQFPNLQHSIAIIKSTPLSFQPFKTWSQSQPSKSIPWWENYNSVKHDRVNNFKLASFENALTILSALFILEMLYYDKLYNVDSTAYCNIPDKMSNLFKLKDHKLRLRNDCIEKAMDYPIEGYQS